MTIFNFLEGQTGLPSVFLSAFAAVVLLGVMGMLVRRQLAAANGGVIPDEGVTLRNFLELIVEGLGNLARDNMGDEWRRWFPLVATIFVFILVSNLMGLVPGLGGPTSDVNTNAAWALISVLIAEYVGVRKHGWGYVKHFIGPAFDFKIGGKTRHLYLMAPLFIILELIGHVARVVTLTIRLLANMFADHTLVAIWLGLFPVVIPAVFLGLGLIVAVLQAFVFSLLTMVYIGLALEEAH